MLQSIAMEDLLTIQTVLVQASVAFQTKNSCSQY